MAQKYHRICFECRKCGNVIVARFDREESVRHALLKIEKVASKCCPHCGEEPYENWMLYEVRLLPEASQ